jgi:hypothetical protein
MLRLMMDCLRHLPLAVVFTIFCVSRPGVHVAAAEVQVPTAPEIIASGDTLELRRILLKEPSDEFFFAKLFLLGIPISIRPGVHLQMRDMVIHVLFFDLVGDQDVGTSARVTTRWDNRPVDWVDSNPEWLWVEYDLPKPNAEDAKREKRSYFGYIVRVYYQGRLQAATAEPALLADKHPPSPTLP